MTNKIQIQYSLSQFLYWVSCCSCCGFVAVYLQYKGLSNTMVGLVVGLYGLLAIVTQPLMAKIVTMIPKLTVKIMIEILLIAMILMFGFITFLPLPLLPVIVIFITINGINSSVNPMLNVLGMEYANQKRKIDYGIARGIGSFGWASAAIVLGLVLAHFTPDVLGYAYIIAAATMLVLVFSMEDLGLLVKENASEKKEKGVFMLIMKDPVILWVAVGLFLLLSCHSIGTVFTINIVRNVGGTEATAGVAQFFGAGSELLGMVIFSIIIRRIHSLNILKICGLFFILRFGLLLFAHSIPMVIFTYFLQGPSTGLNVAAAVYFINDRLEVNKQTQGQAIFFMLTSGFAGCVGSFAGGWLQDRFGLHMALLCCVFLCVIGCICILTQFDKNYKTRLQ